MLARVVSGVDLVLTGIGKSNAAGAVARVFDAERHIGVLNLGIGGMLPGAEQAGVALGTVVNATASVFADEGIVTEKGFTDCAGMGFPLGDFHGSAVPTDPRVASRIRSTINISGRVATVSTCSGTDALALQAAERTGAIVEAMEGAAVGLVCHRLRVPFAEVRVVSNTTGDRERQQWDMKGAVSKLELVASALRG